MWWKSPAQFNDPFDTQIQLNLGCTTDEIAAELDPRMAGLILSSDEPGPDLDERVQQVILAARPLAARINPRELLGGLRTGLQLMVPQIQNALDGGQTEWLRYVTAMRVLCVSEIKDDILMWSHYADCHRGAVLELRALPGEQGALREAMPIRYSQNIPVMASAAQWVDHVLGVRHIDFDAFFHDFAFTKSEHWRYEKEWRCRILNANRTLDVPEMEDTWACPLLPEEVVAVYLGCRMESANRAAILDAMQSSLPSSEVHEAIKSPTRFALEFRRVLP